MLSIRPARQEKKELSRLANIQRVGFAEFPVEQLMFGAVLEEDYLANVINRLSHAIDDPHQELRVAEVNGKVVGWALWRLPLDSAQEPDGITDEERLRRAKERYPPGTNWELATQFFRPLNPPIREPHLHLSVLVVDPSTRRTGAGTALIQWGTAFADERRVNAYLKATDVGMSVYQKQGYEIFRDPIIGGPNGEMVLHPMRRSARPEDDP